jgi:hypothetical protein
MVENNDDEKTENKAASHRKSSLIHSARDPRQKADPSSRVQDELVRDVTTNSENLKTICGPVSAKVD